MIYVNYLDNTISYSRKRDITSWLLSVVKVKAVSIHLLLLINGEKYVGNVGNVVTLVSNKAPYT